MTAASGLSLLRESIKDRTSEGAQAALVAQVLVGLGYRQKPEVFAVPLERGATMRAYVWDDTPFGDALVLFSGPSVEPEILLGREIPSAPPERGFYIRGGAAHGKTPERVLDRVSRALQAKVEKVAKVAAKTEARREVARARAAAPPPVVVVAPPPPPPAPAPKAVERAPRPKRQSAQAQKLALLQQGLQNFARSVMA